MVDQSFSAENFRKIFDYENRKGVYLEGDFFPEVEKITKKIKESTRKIKDHRKKKGSIDTDEYEAKKDELNKEKNAVKEKKEALLTKELEKISLEIAEKNFVLGLKKVNSRKGKMAYSYERKSSSYFALKQIQYNLRKLYKVKQGNRHNIVCQLREILSDPFPKHIIKTDISSFYESIPRGHLLKKLNDDPLLTLTSKKIIRRILHEYGQMSGQVDGLPRGIGISAYLAELYMRQFDSIIQAKPNLIYYARYVDDIIIVCFPQTNSDIAVSRDEIKKHTSNLGLNINEDKTYTRVVDGKSNITLDYLGYRFNFGHGAVQLSLTNSKIEKYKKRIQLTFEAYKNSAIRNEKAARKILLKRIRFLTGNTRLVNNKKNAVVGIYFSYSLLTDPSCLNDLDSFLSNEISNISIETLKEKLSSYTFTSGFEQRKFYKFSASDLKNIVEVWKYAS